MTNILLPNGTQVTGQFSCLFSLCLRIYYNLFPNLYNYNTKSYTITTELAHIKWISNKDEKNKKIFVIFYVTNSKYLVLTEDIKLCFRKLITKNKTVITAVYNKKNCFFNCYMFQPVMVTKGQENLHFPGCGIN